MGPFVDVVHWATRWSHDVCNRMADFAATKVRTMRRGMVVGMGSAGFALSRGVSFEGFLPASPTIVSTDQ
jgi:hypothetical protein